MVVRFYSSTAAETILSGTINNVATTINVADVTGFPVSYPYTLALDYESASEELVDVTAAAGTSLTITRAVDGTSATGHSAGARVRHVSSGRDHRDSRNHENAEAGVHGVTGDVVGTTDTQTLTNKTLSNATGTLNRIDILSEGGSPWVTTVNGDTTGGPSADLMQWKRDPAATHEVARVSNSGAVVVRNADPAADSVFNTMRFRVVKDDGTTGIFNVTSGGEVTAVQDAGQNGFTALGRVDNSANTAFRVRDAANAVTLFRVWQDGRVDVSPSNPAFSQFDVICPAGQSAAMMRVMNSDETSMFEVQSSGRTLANRGATVAQPGVLTGTLLQVGGSNTGYTGNLQTWVSPANAVVAAVNQSGYATFTPRAFTSGASGASGWSITEQVMRESAGVTYVNATWTRTGGNIAVSGTGNIPDTQIGSVPASWRAAENIYAHAASGVGSGSARINAGGTVDLLDWTPNRTIVTGEQIRVTWTFIS